MKHNIILLTVFSLVLVLSVVANVLIPRIELGYPGKVPQWDHNFNDRNYRIGVKLTNDQGMTVTDHVVNATINFTAKIEQLGVDTSLYSLAPNSVRISEHAEGGGLVNSDVNFSAE